MELEPEVRERHAALSATHLRFLEYMEENPEGLDRAHFDKVHVRDEFTPYLVQSWPIFLGAERRREFERAGGGLSKLVRSLPRRVFDNQPQKLSEFYRLDPNQGLLISSLIRSTRILEGAAGRGDFVDTDQGLMSVEYNASGNISGWQTYKYLDRYVNTPVIRRFIDQEIDGEVYFRSPLHTLYVNFIHECRDLATDGELNLCVAVSRAGDVGEWADFMAAEWSAVLAAEGDGLEGRFVPCTLNDLKTSAGALRVDGVPVHIVYEPSYGYLTRPLMLALLAGKARLYNGPNAVVLGDKGNLALLSDPRYAELYTDDERAVIADHVPWTRLVVAEETSYEDERVYLPDFLLAAREKLVLKPRSALGGRDVYVGPFTPEEKWRAVTRRALREGDWVAQQYLRAHTYQFLTPRSGAMLHDLVWGLFTLGDRYGGNYFRVQTPDHSQGVVNATRGGSFGIILEVEGERDETRAADCFPVTRSAEPASAPA